YSVNRLIMEIMGKHSNIILVEKDTSTIIDSIKRVPEHISRVRQIYPSLVYEMPPKGDKYNPLNITKEEFLDLINQEEKNLQIFKFFYSNFLGIGPLIGREICFLANIDIDRIINSLQPEDIENLYHNFEIIMTKVKNKDFTPHYIKTDANEIKAFHSINIEQFGIHHIHYDERMSFILDTYYRNKDMQDRIKQKTQSIRKNIKNKLDRVKSKMEKQVM